MNILLRLTEVFYFSRYARQKIEVRKTRKSLTFKYIKHIRASNRLNKNQIKRLISTLSRKSDFSKDL